METVNRLPRPADPAALERLVEAQRLLCARAVSEEDCQEALSLLLELAKPVEEDGFGYAPALLTVASLYESGFEPGIARNMPQAARCYLALMESQIPSGTLGPELLEEAANSALWPGEGRPGKPPGHGDSALGRPLAEVRVTAWCCGVAPVCCR